MKKNKKLYILLFVIIFLGLSCSDFEEMNIDPNNPTQVPTSGLLTQAQASLIYNINGELSQLGCQYVQYFTQIDYVEKSNYNEAGTSDFSEIYSGGLTNLKKIIELNTNDDTKLEVLKYGENENQIAIAKILTAWAFHNITDIWGDVPYSDALKGDEDVFTPVYDRQEYIYDNLINELNNAISMINVNPEHKIYGDLIFDGDIEMWKKFAYSLKLRIAMRLSEVNDAKANELINDIDFDNAFSELSDIAKFEHLSTEAEANPLYIDNVINEGGDYFALASTFVDLLNDLDDPRLGYYAKPTINSGIYVGLEVGIEGSDEDVSLISDLYAGQTAPTILMTLSEVLFIKAEAAQRGYISGNASQFYNDAIIASMEFNGIENADILTYLSQSDVQYNSNNWQMLIGTQKWIALYSQGIQAWAEWRRLKYPSLTPGVNAVTPTIPRRRAYPSVEYSSNFENVSNAVENIGGEDSFLGKVWWDQ